MEKHELNKNSETFENYAGFMAMHGFMDAINLHFSFNVRLLEELKKIAIESFLLHFVAAGKKITEGGVHRSRSESS